jgi:hypothetical protein
MPAPHASGNHWDITIGGIQIYGEVMQYFVSFRKDVVLERGITSYLFMSTLILPLFFFTYY